MSLGGLEPPTYSLKGSHSAIELQALGDPTGIRTQVTRLKTSCPSPLDDGAPNRVFYHFFEAKGNLGLGEDFFLFNSHKTHPLFNNLKEGFKGRLNNKVEEKSQNIQVGNLNGYPLPHSDNGQEKKIN